MKILLVSSFLPYPLFSGGHIRLYNLMKELSTRHEITLICEKRPNQNNEDVAAVKKICKAVYTVPRKKQWTIQNIVTSAFSRYPFLLVGHTSKAMKQKIVEVLNQQHFDIIHVETFYVYQNLPKTYLPVVLVEHNIEYEVYKKFTDTSRPYLRPLLNLDVQKIAYWEKKFWQQATKLVAVSEKEKKEMQREDVTVVPNGVDIKKYLYHNAKSKFKKKEKRILFIGDFKWIQNIVSAEWILKEIWPEIELRMKNKELRVKLWIVGKNVPEQLKNLGDDSIIFDENAPEETQKIYEKSHVLLAPIKVGGGTSYKIIESMASGIPVVTTRLGIEGLQAIPEKEALVGSTAEELATSTVRLLQDEITYEKITKAARSRIEKDYSWEKIAHTLESVYLSSV